MAGKLKPLDVERETKSGKHADGGGLYPQGAQRALIFTNPDVELNFNDPKHDSRTPDILVQPIYGTTYTTSKKKNAEHGGMSFGDTNVGLVVSHPNLKGVTIKTPVITSQVAPTILRALDIEPEMLNSVRVEHTTVLPGLWDNR